jgi:hypothetical protein
MMNSYVSFEGGTWGPSARLPSVPKDLTAAHSKLALETLPTSGSVNHGTRQAYTPLCSAMEDSSMLIVCSTPS